jgi:hypothetical protein
VKEEGLFLALEEQPFLICRQLMSAMKRYKAKKYYFAMNKQHLRLFWLPSAILILAACQREEQAPPFIDRLAKQYAGSYEHYICGFPSTSQFSIGDAQATISKLSDTEIQVSISAAPIGALMEFEAFVDSDSTFAIPEFLSNEAIPYTGRGQYVDRLVILIGEECVDGLLMPRATYVFAERR